MDTANVVVSGQEPTTLSNSDWSDFVEASTLAVFTPGFGQLNVSGESTTLVVAVSMVSSTALVTVQGYSPDVSVTSNQHITVGSSSILVTGNQINFVYVSRETPDRRRIKLDSGGKQIGLAGNNRSVSVSLHSRKLKILPKQ